MPEPRETAADRLADAIHVVLLTRQTGVLTATRRSGSEQEKGTIVFQAGKILDVYAEGRQEIEALDWLKTWGVCRYKFAHKTEAEIKAFLREKAATPPPSKRSVQSASGKLPVVTPKGISPTSTHPANQNSGKNQPAPPTVSRPQHTDPALPQPPMAPITEPMQPVMPAWVQQYWENLVNHRDTGATPPHGSLRLSEADYKQASLENTNSQQRPSGTNHRQFPSENSHSQQRPSGTNHRQFPSENTNPQQRPSGTNHKQFPSENSHSQQRPSGTNHRQFPSENTNSQQRPTSVNHKQFPSENSHSQQRPSETDYKQFFFENTNPQPKPRVPQRVEQSADVLKILEQRGLSRLHRHIFLLINGERAVTELATLTGRSVQEAQQLLNDLMQAGFIRL